MLAANVRSKGSRRTCVTLPGETSRQPCTLSLIPARLAPSKTEHVDLDVDYATTLVAAVLLGIGFVLQQYAARQEPECLFLSPRIIVDLLQDESDPKQDGRYESGRVVHIQVHVLCLTRC